MKKKALQNILAIFARWTIQKYRPRIVGVTGSVGKTSTVGAISAVLGAKHRVRGPEKNYNNEIGLPLTIVGLPHYGKSILGWISGFLAVFYRMVVRDRRYPEILILEYGVDRPGDMDYLCSLARPDIAVVTAIGEIPVHVEYFADPEELTQEKEKIVSAIAEGGTVVLHHDDPRVLDMGTRTHARVVTFGQEEHADFRIEHVELRAAKDERVGDVPDGISFKITQSGHTVPLRLHHTFGMPQVYAAGVAAAVGSIMGMNLVEISDALRKISPPAGRLRLLAGIKHSFILDDTYNAAPESMRAALETLEKLPGKRKIAVLGDMLELGKYTEQAHRAVGDQAAGVLDILFCVGVRAKFIAEEARAGGLNTSGRVLASENIFVFDDSVQAGKALDPLIREGDLILVKGSQGMRMERAVLEIMRHPEQASELLVRQEEYWRQT